MDYNQPALPQEAILGLLCVPKSQCKIYVVDYDVVRMRVDVVVSPSSADLQPVDGAGFYINSAAGPKILNELSNLPHLQVGDAVLTQSYSISNIRGIIHTLGPNYHGSKNAISELSRCYINSFNIISQRNYQSASFCSISCGIFGFPPDLSAKVAFKICLDFILENKCPSLRDVYFSVYKSDPVKREYTKFISDLSRMDPNYLLNQIPQIFRDVTNNSNTNSTHGSSFDRQYQQQQYQNPSTYDNYGKPGYNDNNNYSGDRTNKPYNTQNDSHSNNNSNNYGYSNNNNSNDGWNMTDQASNLYPPQNQSNINQNRNDTGNQTNPSLYGQGGSSGQADTNKHNIDNQGRNMGPHATPGNLGFMSSNKDLYSDQPYGMRLFNLIGDISDRNARENQDTLGSGGPSEYQQQQVPQNEYSTRPNPQSIPQYNYQPQSTQQNQYPPQSTQQNQYPPQSIPQYNYPPQSTQQNQYPPQSTQQNQYPTQSTQQNQYPPQSIPQDNYPPQSTHQSMQQNNYPPQPTQQNNYSPQSAQQNNYPPLNQYPIQPQSHTDTKGNRPQESKARHIQQQNSPHGFP